jgi:hypothetical protein
MFKQISFELIIPRYTIHVHLLTDDGKPAITAITEPAQQFWGLTNSVIMERCRIKHKLLPSSSYCNANSVWTSVFRVEEDFEIETGICK